MNSSIEIVMRKIGELKPYENNPRHNDMAVDAVAASIQQFGFKNPVIIDKDGVIVAGHTRYKAAKKLGITTYHVSVQMIYRTSRLRRSGWQTTRPQSWQSGTRTYWEKKCRES